MATDAAGLRGLDPGRRAVVLRCTSPTAPRWRYGSSSRAVAAATTSPRSPTGCPRARWTVSTSARPPSSYPSTCLWATTPCAPDPGTPRRAHPCSSPRAGSVCPSGSTAGPGGASPPSSTASVHETRGVSATSPTSPTSASGPPASAPTTSSSTRCTPPSRRRRWSPPPTCPARGASSTRSTSASSGSPSTSACPPPRALTSTPWAPGVHDRLDDADVIDRDTAWTAKRTALRHVFAVPRSAGRELDLASFTARRGRGAAALRDLVRARRGARARLPRLAGGAAGRRLARGRLVHRRPRGRDRPSASGSSGCSTSSSQVAQGKTVGAGMALGTMHDLAVGVHPGGADAWRLRSTYATGIRWAHRPTRSTSRARTGPSRRGSRHVLEA